MKTNEQIAESGKPPFTIQEEASTEGTYWVAIDHASGIVGCGRATATEAHADRLALNAAWCLGRSSPSAASKPVPEGSKPCVECGERALSVTPFIRNTTGVVDGKLKMHDLTISYAVGCDNCSHTVGIFDTRELALSSKGPSDE